MSGVYSGRELRNAYTILIGQSEGRNHFGDLGNVRVDFIKTYVAAIACGGVDWIYVARDGIELTGSCEADDVHSCLIRGRIFLD
jgi:hypothetical protein